MLLFSWNNLYFPSSSIRRYLGILQLCFSTQKARKECGNSPHRGYLLTSLLLPSRSRVEPSLFQENQNNQAVAHTMSTSKKLKQQKEKKTHSACVGGMETRLAMTGTVKDLSARAQRSLKAEEHQGRLWLGNRVARAARAHQMQDKCERQQPQGSEILSSVAFVMQVLSYSVCL